MVVQVPDEPSQTSRPRLKASERAASSQAGRCGANGCSCSMQANVAEASAAIISRAAKAEWKRSAGTSEAKHRQNATLAPQRCATSRFCSRRRSRPRRLGHSGRCHQSRGLNVVIVGSNRAHGPSYERRTRPRRLERVHPGALHDQCLVSALPPMGMRFALSSALGDFGSATVSTPFLNDASAFSSSTSNGSAMRRSNRP